MTYQMGDQCFCALSQKVCFPSKNFGFARKMLCSFVSEHKELLENAKVVVFFM